MRCDKNDVTMQIVREQRQLKSSILKSRNQRNEMNIQILPGENEKAKITVLLAGLTLLIIVAFTLGLFIGLLDPVSIDSQQTTKTVPKACQGNYKFSLFHII